MTKEHQTNDFQAIGIPAKRIVLEVDIAGMPCIIYEAARQDGGFLFTLGGVVYTPFGTFYSTVQQAQDAASNIARKLKPETLCTKASRLIEGKTCRQRCG
jgi:hypothetical protein